MPTDLHRNDVQQMMSHGAQLIDVLPKAEYTAEHLPGAINILLKALDAKTTTELDKEQPVIVYCHDTQ